MNDYPLDFCPYKGLQPYTEADRAFFFGRERDREVIISNLHAARVTILYGPPGVGKSSILLAGVLPKLKELPRVLPIIFRDWQNPGFESGLKEVLRSAIPGRVRKTSADPELPFDELILKLIGPTRSTMFVLFDQFEEYLFYHPSSQAMNGFEAEFASAVNRTEIDVHFLLSMRDDGISKLDRFQGRIPALLNNMLRLDHLDRRAADAAIRKPLDEYNRERSTSGRRIDIENDLVESLLDELRMGKVTLEQGGQGHLSTTPSNELKIETPFLQMVLTRLWAEEMAIGSQMLRLDTLQKLGGAERIVRSHLDKVMTNLAEPEREIAARIFRFLVTPTGVKIALTADDLASFAEIPASRIEPALTLLSSAPHRILRSIPPPPQQKGKVRYEIFHDVLAAGIIDWRSRYDLFKEHEQVERLAKEERERQEQRARALRRQRWLRVMTVVVAVLALLASVAVWQSLSAKKARDEAVSERRKAEDSRNEAVKAKEKYEEISNQSLALSALFDEAVRNYVLADARGKIRKGDTAAAKTSVERIIELSQRTGNRTIEGQMLTFIGFFFKGSNSKMALDYFRKAVNAHKAQSAEKLAMPVNQIQLAVSLDNLAMLAYYLARPGSGEAAYAQEAKEAYAKEFAILDGNERSSEFTTGRLETASLYYLRLIKDKKSTEWETARSLTERVLAKYPKPKSKR